MIVLAVPDLHCPYQHPKALPFLSDLKREYRPDKVVFLGDEIDAHSFSRFPHDPDLESPGTELAQAVEALEPFYSLFPRAQVCESNHTLRPYRKASEAGLPRRLLVSLRKLLHAPARWRWAFEHRIDGVTYRHGDGFGGKYPYAAAAERLRCKVVIGHVHAHSGVHRFSGLDGEIWGANVGCLIDPKHRAFAYAKTGPYRPTLGAAVIVNGCPPTLIPLEP